MAAADTNLLLRLILRDDAAQTAAAEAVIAQGAWTSHLALAEAVWVLQSVYGRSPAALAEAVTLLLDASVVAVEHPGVVRAALVLFRKHPRLGFSDCLLVEQARAAGQEPLGTFDRGLARLPGTRLLA